MIIFLKCQSKLSVRMIEQRLVPKWRGRLVQTFKKQIQSIAIHCKPFAAKALHQTNLFNVNLHAHVTTWFLLAEESRSQSLGTRNRRRNKRHLLSSSKSWRIEHKAIKTTDINSTTGFKRTCTTSSRINQGVPFPVFRMILRLGLQSQANDVLPKLGPKRATMTPSVASMISSMLLMPSWFSIFLATSTPCTNLTDRNHDTNVEKNVTT